MAFVGYKTEADATAALEYFNNTFVDTSKIQVEYARAVKSSALPRPWSKHSEGSSAHRRANAPEQDPDAPPPLDPDRFIGVRELKKMQKAKRHAFERELDEMIEADPKLKEFMELMAPRSKQKIWDNQDAAAFGGDAGTGAQGDAQGGAQGGAGDERPAFVDDGSDDDEYQDFDDEEGKAGAARGMKKKRQTAGASAGASHQRRRRESDDSDDSEVSEDSDDSDESDDDGVDEIAGDENVSDMDYLRKRAAVGSFSDSEDEDEDGSEDEDEDGSDEDDSDDEDGSDEDDEDGSDENGSGTPADGDSKPGDARVVTAEDMEAVADTGRVFVRNLPFTATEEEVAAHFARHGALTAVHIIVDRATRRSKGLAYITYALPENGMKAMEDLDGTIFQGRLIQCLPAKRPPAADATLGGVGRAGMEGTGDGDGDGDGDGKRPQTEAEREAGFKAARDARLKADAGTNRAAWNTLFMRQDTVAAAIAAKYGVSKADLLESGDSDVAVRMALGEAQIIAETKEQLAASGVNPARLEAAAAAGGAAAGKGRPGVKRSSTAIVLKNLPYEAEESDLRAMCERFGGLARLALPDTKAIAVAEWLEPADARKAFKGLAYKRYKHVPIYVEWAPEGVFSGDAPKVSAAPGKTPRADGGGRGAAAAEMRDKLLSAASPEDDGDEEATKIFVKGLSFQTSEAALRAHFLRAAAAAGGRVLAASIATQRGPGGANLSRGFGFVEFDTSAAARSARRAMQGEALEGRALKLEMSSGRKTDDDAVGGSGGSEKVPKGFSATKIVVRNVAFEATKRDVQKLFNPFGALKSCRLPKKFDGNHRGFAFVELSTKREASAALEALRGTHLYGRRLTIERAAEDDDVAAIREKTAARFDAADAGRAAAEGEAVFKRRKRN